MLLDLCREILSRKDVRTTEVEILLRKLSPPHGKRESSLHYVLAMDYRAAKWMKQFCFLFVNRAHFEVFRKLVMTGEDIGKT